MSAPLLSIRVASVLLDKGPWAWAKSKARKWRNSAALSLLIMDDVGLTIRDEQVAVEADNDAEWYYSFEADWRGAAVKHNYALGRMRISQVFGKGK